MVLPSQESFEEGYKADYPTDDSGIHPDYSQALHNLLSTSYEDVLGVKGASGVSGPRPLKLRRSVGAKTPQTSSQRSSVAPCAGGPCAVGSRRGGPRDGDPAEGGQLERSRLARLWQINLVVLDERSAVTAVVCINRTAFQLPAEFHLLAAFSGTGKSYDRDIEGI